jgi:hypothetical protein
MKKPLVSTGETNIKGWEPLLKKQTTVDLEQTLKKVQPIPLQPVTPWPVKPSKK